MCTFSLIMSVRCGAAAPRAFGVANPNSLEQCSRYNSTTDVQNTSCVESERGASSKTQVLLGNAILIRRAFSETTMARKEPEEEYHKANRCCFQGLDPTIERGSERFWQSLRRFYSSQSKKQDRRRSAEMEFEGSPNKGLIQALRLRYFSERAVRRSIMETTPYGSM